MAILNGSFETAGVLAGEALGWSVTTGATVYEYAELSTRAAEESFAWYSLWLTLPSVTVVVAEFLLERFDDFGNGWIIGDYAVTRDGATWIGASFTGSATKEDFGVGYSVDPFYLDWASVSVVTAAPDFTAPSGWATDWASITAVSFGSAEDFYWVVN